MLTEFYVQHRASVHADVKSKQFHLKRETKQVDPPSTLLFITLLQHIMKPLSAKWSRENHEVRFAEHDRDANFSNLRLASGILLISSSLNHTKPMIDDLTIATTEHGLHLRSTETKIISSTTSKTRNEQHGSSLKG